MHRSFSILKRCVHTRAFASPLLEDMNARGLIAQITSENLVKAAQNEPLTVYLGVDPTARSLHAGNLLALMGLLHFHIRGHPAIALIGGATGSIGDPGGRRTERPLLSKQQLDENVSGLTAQVHNFFVNAAAYAQGRIEMPDNLPPPRIMNNMDWFQGISLLEFLRTVGKHAKVNVMLGRESVKTRLETEQGISFTEFSYQLLQAYDFSHLHRMYNCRVQLGGSDQWGNIVSGTDYIRRQYTSDSKTMGPPPEVFGLTMPLLLTSSGEKFGKSSGNAVWLDHTMTSFFDFYQFFIHLNDVDALGYLYKFTLLPLSGIKQIAAQHLEHPEKRLVQRKLASEVTELVHGLQAVRKAEAATNILFNSDALNIHIGDVLEALRFDPRLKQVNRDEILGRPLTKLAMVHNLSKSRGDAKNTLAAGGLYLNNRRITSDRVLEASDLIDNGLAVLRTGKDNHVILAII